MRNAILILLLVLAGQVVLMFLTSREPAVTRGDGDGPLIVFDAAAVREMRLSDGATGEELVLHRDGQGWVLPDYFTFRADAARVDALLERLAGFGRGWPEATTAGAAERFRVAEGAFERRLTLTTGTGDAVTAWFGSSPGFRRIYCRAEGSEAIYAVALGLHELPAAAREWIDTGVLHEDIGKLAGLELPGIRLVKGEAGLEPEGLLENEEVNREEVERLVKSAAALEISEVLAADVPQAGVLDSPELTIRFTREDGAEVVYELARPLREKSGETAAGQPEGEQAEEQDSEDDGREAWYLLRTPGQDQVFRIDGWQVSDLVDVKRDDLVRPVEQEEQSAASGPAPEADRQ